MFRSVTVTYFTLLLFILAGLSEREQPTDVFEKFQQNDYNVTPERTEVIRRNKAYVNRFEFDFFKFNRTCTAFNFTFNWKVNMKDVVLTIQAYKFMSNEYRLFPLRMEYNLCDMSKANIFGLGMHSCGNMTTCSAVKQGTTYRFCNWVPDQSKLPPFIPSGRYMLGLQYNYNSNEIAFAYIYVAVTRPEIKSWVKI